MCAAIVVAAPDPPLHRVVAGGLERTPRHVELLDIKGLRQGRGRQQQGAADANGGGNHVFPAHRFIAPSASRTPAAALSASPAPGNGARATLLLHLSLKTLGDIAGV
jgi:hypothetical protein